MSWARPGATIITATAIALYGATAAAVPAFEHVAVVVLENHSYDEVRLLSYCATLADSGASFANSFGIAHPSQPNYLALWSGSTQGVKNDTCPPKGAPYSTENLGHACEAAGLTWRAYSENLPAPGSSICATAPELYVRKHSAWRNFTNLNHMNERPFEDLAAAESLGTLPNLVFVCPNQCNNGHDCSLATSDAWLAAHIPALLRAAGPNGLVIVTWDEDDTAISNHIMTLLVGPKVRPGVVSTQSITHFTVLRLICDALGLPPFGGATTEALITDIWTPVPSDVTPGTAIEASLGGAYPNPSHGPTTVELWLPHPQQVQATVFDLAGRRVRVLDVARRAGAVNLTWDGLNEAGGRASRGLYLLQVRAGNKLLRRKLTRID